MCIATCVHGEQMKWAHDMVLTSMREIFACFEGGSSEVKRERRALVAQTDSSIEVRASPVPMVSFVLTWEAGPNRQEFLCDL